MANDQFQGVEKFLPGLVGSAGDVRVAQIAWGGAPAQMQQPLGGSLLLVDVSGY